MKTILRIALLGMAAVAVSCSNHGPQWHLQGSVEGLAEGDNIILEANNQGYWYPVDTIEADKKGRIDYAGDAHGYPDIFRLRIGDSSVYFPVDSIETVTITATAPDIAANHTLGGSPQAENLAKVDSLLAANAAAGGVKSLPGNQELKKQLVQMILADPAGVVSYYIISKTVGDTPLYNPSDNVDHRIIGAVANAFNTLRPDDPRTKYLKKLFLSNRRPSATSAGPSVEAQVIRAFEIDLYDQTGKRHSLLETTAKGNPVILNFTAYGAEWSPALNVALNKVYDKYHSQGLEIYQVSIDEDEYTWKQSAKNLPWITVYNNVADGASVLRQYNVDRVPTIFIFNRDGEVVERVLDMSQLESAVAKVM